MDRRYLSDEIHVDVIRTPGHSTDELSYRIGNMAFIGDAVPVRGDIPIFIHLDNTRNSLAILEKLPGIETFYPAWDQVYSLEMMHLRINSVDARALIVE